MKRRLALLAATLLSISCVGIGVPASFRITGPDGEPVEAYITYYYGGKGFAIGHPRSYTRGAGITRTDADGQASFRWIVYLKLPLDSWLEPQFQLIYAPRLHAAGHFWEGRQRQLTGIEISADRKQIRVQNMAHPPSARLASFETLINFVDGYWFQADEVPRRQKPVYIELARGTIKAHDDLVATLAETPRTISDEALKAGAELPTNLRERKLQEEYRDSRLYPNWGPYIKKKFRPQIAKLKAGIGR